MTFVVCLLLWLAWSAPAAADPSTIGFIIVSTIASAEVAGTAVIGSITVAQIVGTAVVVGGAIGLQYALRPDQSTPKPQDGQVITRQPIPARRRGYGTLKVGGPLLFSETHELTRYQLIALHHGRISRVLENWFAEFFVVVDGGGNVLGRYLEGVDPRVQVFPHLGTDTQIADGLLTSVFPSLWTSAHQAKGVAYVVVATTETVDSSVFTTTYPGGVPPVYRAVIQASLVWDPRDGDQDKDDPDTWEWSANPVLIALDFHRHADGMGLSAFDDVYFTDAAIDEDWIPAANICDEEVGGVVRYSCSGSYELPNDAPANVLDAIFNTCDGQPYERSDGAIGIRVGKDILPSVTFTDAHIIAYDGFKRGDNVFLACNEVTAKYTSPDHDYQETDAQAWRDEDDITERGQVITKAIPLQWVTNHSQARRLMKLAHARFNPEWQGTIITNLAGFEARNQRYIHLTISEIGIDGPFEVTSFEAAIGGDAITCAIGVISLDQSVFDWDEATEAGTPPPVPDGVLG